MTPTLRLRQTKWRTSSSAARTRGRACPRDSMRPSGYGTAYGIGMTQNRREILEALGSEPTMGRAIGAAAKLQRLRDAESIPVSFAILRNVTLEPGLPAAIQIEAARAGLDSSVLLGEFDNAQQEAYDEHSAIYACDPDIVVLALRLQTLAPRLLNGFTSLTSADVEELTTQTLQRVLSLIGALRARTSATILVHNFEVPSFAAYGVLDATLAQGQRATLRSLNAALASAIGQHAATYSSISTVCSAVSVTNARSTIGIGTSHGLRIRLRLRGG